MIGPRQVGAALEACLKRHGLLPERDRDEPRKAAGKVTRGEVGNGKLEGGLECAQQSRRVGFGAA